MALPQGNGYFIWLLNRLAPPTVLAKQAKDSGLSWVALKIADGIQAFQNDRLANAVSAFKAEGIKVFGWHYVYGYNVTGEAAMAERQMKGLDLEGYIINAEWEYKNKPAQAAALLSGLRYRLPNKPIGICSYRYPYLHPEFPWAQFMNTDFNMPQVYWMGAQNAGYQVRRSYLDFQRFRRIPFIPIGSAFTEYGWKPTIASLYDFTNTVKQMNLPTYGWWEWYHAAVVNPQFWQPTVSGSPIVPPTPDPAPTKKVTTRFNSLRYRKDPTLTGRIMGYVPMNRVYTVTKESGAWGYLAELGGWAHLSYMTIVP